ncbi:MAG: 50S ribosomal protein L21 [bacterium]
MEKTEKKEVKKVSKAKVAKTETKAVSEEVVKAPKTVAKKVAPVAKAKIDKTKFAIVEINNQQEKVYEGEKLVVDLQHEDNLVFDKVLLFVNGEKSTFGTPYIAGATVKGKRIDNFKDKKISVSTFKAKSRYRKTIGHREQKSNILIESINIK